VKNVPNPSCCTRAPVSRFADEGCCWRIVSSHGSPVTAENPNIQLVFNRANGSVVNLVDKATGIDLISQKVGNYDGFVFSFTTPTNSAPQNAGGYVAQSISLNPANAAGGVTQHFRARVRLGKCRSDPDTDSMVI